MDLEAVEGCRQPPVHEKSKGKNLQPLLGRRKEALAVDEEFSAVKAVKEEVKINSKLSGRLVAFSRRHMSGFVGTGVLFC